jgi:4-carboxymuconolactone decarboxylase
MPAKKSAKKASKKAVKKAARKSPAKKTTTKAPIRKMQPPRLPPIPDDQLTPAQVALMESIRSGPRGRLKMTGPFFCFLHSPEYGELAQKLGAYVRLGTSIPPRLSEFAILATAQAWKSQYEWAAHAGIAEQKGVKPETIRDLQAGRLPKKAPKDEQALFAFVQELYRDKRVSNPTYKKMQAILGDAGMVELVGLLGYYGLVAMTLDVFRMPVPDGSMPFAEPAVR